MVRGANWGIKEGIWVKEGKGGETRYERVRVGSVRGKGKYGYGEGLW